MCGVVTLSFMPLKHGGAGNSCFCLVRYFNIFNATVTQRMSDLPCCYTHGPNMKCEHIVSSGCDSATNSACRSFMAKYQVCMYSQKVRHVLEWWLLWRDNQSLQCCRVVCFYCTLKIRLIFFFHHGYIVHAYHKGEPIPHSLYFLCTIVSSLSSYTLIMINGFAGNINERIASFMHEHAWCFIIICPHLLLYTYLERRSKCYN